MGEVLFKIHIGGLEGTPEQREVNAGFATEFGQLPLIAKAAAAFFE